MAGVPPFRRLAALCLFLWLPGLSSLAGCSAEHIIGSLGFRVEVYASGTAPGRAQSIAIADVDADGHNDVILVDHGGAQVCWLPGLGDGRLGSASCKPNGQVADACLVIAGKFTSQLGQSSGQSLGPADLIIAGSTVEILEGRGDGGFSLIDAAIPDGGAAALVAEDVNLDGNLDVLVADRTSATVSLWPLNTDRTLGPRLRYEFAEPQRAILFADLNGDGRKELAGLSSSGLSIYGALGAATIAQCPVPAGQGARFADPTALAAFDSEGDGDTDVLLADGAQGGLVRVRRSASWTFDCGDGGLWQPAGRVVALLGADFDGDGAKDELALSEAGVALLFRSASVAAAGAVPRYLLPAAVQGGAVGDLDGDGLPEAVAALRSGEVAVLRNVFLPKAKTR